METVGATGHVVTRNYTLLVASASIPPPSTYPYCDNVRVVTISTRRCPSPGPQMYPAVRPRRSRWQF